MKPYTDIEQSRLNNMTQAEKAKRYDVAVKVIKDNLDALNEITETGAEIVNIQDMKNCFYRAFPELRESGDDRIRKWLINTIKQIPDGSIEWETISKSDVLAWLDRPSEENPADKVEPKFHEGDSIYQVASANDGSHYEWNDDKHVLKKIADKVEPKFKVGDWIVQENIGVYKVIEICESWYEVIDAEDNHYSISFDKEHMCHLWDISDAKDGDVLVTNSGRPFIYKGCLDPNNPNSPVAYCGIDTEGHLFAGADKSNRWWTDEEVHPATKEQREQLEKAMVDYVK